MVFFSIGVPMNKDIKSGKEILDEFFARIENIPDINKPIADILKELYQQGKLSDKNIYNALLKQREGKTDGEN